MKAPSCSQSNLGISDTALISRIQKEFKKLNTQKINSPINKWAKKLTRYFTEEEMESVNKSMKKCSTSLATREMPIKTTLKSHLTPVRMAII